MDPKTLSRSLNKFALEFCNELDESSSVCSPVSAEIALALIALGSSNKTHEELLKALDFQNDDAIRSTMSFVTTKLKSMKGTLNVATKVYLNKGDYELKSHLQKDAKEVFEAELEQVNFNEGTAAANHINTWVKEQTNNKITNIVSADMLNANTRMLLLNAIYFKGSWQKPFKTDLTENRQFYVNEKTVIEVPMMKITKEKFRFGYSEVLEASLIELPYSSHESSMVIVLPNEVEGLKGLLQQLASGHDLMADLEDLNKSEVNVTIPKFKIETTLNLKEILQKLGIKSIFDEGSANIDLLTTGEMLYVSDAIQKAFIDVNEEGTEAAAVTVLRIMKKRGPRTFDADRPFLYLLTAHQIPLFIGTYRGIANTPAESR